MIIHNNLSKMKNKILALAHACSHLVNIKKDKHILEQQKGKISFFLVFQSIFTQNCSRFLLVNKTIPLKRRLPEPGCSKAG